MNNTALAEPSANGTASNSEQFKRQLLTTLIAFSGGDHSARLPADLTGLDGKIADTFNDIASRIEHFNQGLAHLRTEVGIKGKIKERMSIGDSTGDWAERVEHVNSLVDGLSQPISEMGRVIG